MAAYRQVYDSRHLQADCRKQGSAPEPYALQSRMGSLYLYLYIIDNARVGCGAGLMQRSGVRPSVSLSHHSPAALRCCGFVAVREIDRLVGGVA